MATKTADDLRLWAHIARTHHEPRLAALLITAADAVEGGALNPVLAWDLALGAAVAAGDHEARLSRCLLAASNALSGAGGADESPAPG
jgi:hypothetical protein